MRPSIEWRLKPWDDLQVRLRSSPARRRVSERPMHIDGLRGGTLFGLETVALAGPAKEAVTPAADLTMAGPVVPNATLNAASRLGLRLRDWQIRAGAAPDEGPCARIPRSRR